MLNFVLINFFNTFIVVFLKCLTYFQEICLSVFLKSKLNVFAKQITYFEKFSFCKILKVRGDWQNTLLHSKSQNLQRLTEASIRFLVYTIL